MNISEIARRAGVAPSTVSYALSGKRSVSEATRHRILCVIEELDYRPDAAARASKEGRTRALGLVLPSAGPHPAGTPLGFVAGVVEAATYADLDVLLFPAGGHDRSLGRIATGRRVDGVILAEVRLEDERVDHLRQAGLPFVAIGRTAAPDGISWVDLDHATVVARCVHRLADLGHRHVALINRPAGELGAGPAGRALAGFTEAALRRGLTGVDLHCDDDAFAGAECMERLRAQHPGVTAVVVANEAALPGVQRALDRSGVAVPRDLSLMGVVPRSPAEAFRPPLTAADLPADLGAHAVKLLLERLARPEAPPRHLLISPPITARATTGPAPA
ncbi:LacI family DNA-binding transcriptional regulator [Sphaerisporangium sp. B11E5]|uniref:LacI family DNA-binding transcriptional regulator n=1 Tax=Sphaerisporangium sp. B11E5 TaxID=3153563 RepID=UPI00325E79C9